MVPFLARLPGLPAGADPGLDLGNNRGAQRCGPHVMELPPGRVHSWSCDGPRAAAPGRVPWIEAGAGGRAFSMSFHGLVLAHVDNFGYKQQATAPAKNFKPGRTDHVRSGIRTPSGFRMAHPARTATARCHAGPETSCATRYDSGARNHGRGRLGTAHSASFGGRRGLPHHT